MMKIYGYLVLLFTLLAVAFATPEASSAVDTKMTAKDSSVIAAASAVSLLPTGATDIASPLSTLQHMQRKQQLKQVAAGRLVGSRPTVEQPVVRRHRRTTEVATDENSASSLSTTATDNFSPQIQSKQQLGEAGKAAMNDESISTVQSIQQPILRRYRRRATEGMKDKDSGNVNGGNREKQSKGSGRRKEPVFKGQAGKFFDKTKEAYRAGKEDRPLFRQYSMPILGGGPYGLALGRPRGGRLRKGGKRDEQRPADELPDEDERKFE